MIKGDVDIDAILEYLATKHGYSKKDIETAVYSQFGFVKQTMQSASKLLGLADAVRLPYFGAFKVKSRIINKYKRIAAKQIIDEKARVIKSKLEQQKFIPKYMKSEITKVRLGLDTLYRSIGDYSIPDGNDVPSLYFVRSLEPLRLAKGWLGETLKILDPKGNPYTAATKARMEGESTVITPEADVSPKTLPLPKDFIQAVDAVRSTLNDATSKIQELHKLIIEKDLNYSPFIFTALEQAWINVIESRMHLGFCLGAIRDMDDLH